jgi:aldehyde:ferredoxin oxidoreductase
METIKGGFVGKLLKVDLNEKKIEMENLDPEIVQRFLGGTGYATRILWDELKPETDPLGPENILVFSTGLLTGTGCPGSDSLFSCFKSPLTHCWGEARCGGGMGVELKRAGFDIVIIKGAAESPVYLWIHNGQAEIRPAGDLWGKTVPETQSALKQEVGDPKSRVICIGPAGEMRVRFANLMVENLRAMGRCGGGAVLGSKNLKAVIIRGTRKVEVANAAELKSLVREMTKLEVRHPESGLSEPDKEAPESTFRAGTASFLPHYDSCGETPTKNAMSNTWGKGKQMYANLKKYIKQSEGCADCVLKCGKRAEVTHGKWKTPLGLYPEYETMVSFGHYLLNDNVEAIIHLNHLCNINGVDTISCGNAVAFAMEGYEKGWITPEDTDGLELSWGNMDAAKTLVKKIFAREGLGDLLGEGVRRAAEVIGKGSFEAAMHVKGLELPAHDTRTEEGGKAWAIQYGTGNRGMCHVHPHEPVIVNSCHDKVVQSIGDIEAVKQPYTEKGKGKLVKWAQDYGNAVNTLGLCNFHTYLVPGSDPDRYVRVLAAVSGLNIDFDDLMTIGERVSNLQRCFNVREGIRRKDDRIPKRLMQTPVDGPFSKRLETAIEDYDAMLDEYYTVRGWDTETGVPGIETLKALDLDISPTELGVE